MPFPSKVVNKKLKVYPKVNPFTKSMIKIKGAPKIVNPSAIISNIVNMLFLKMLISNSLVLISWFTIL